MDSESVFLPGAGAIIRTAPASSSALWLNPANY
jgi:hypothetical protein